MDLDAELDSLFQGPFAEFVGARNALASRLKKEGRAAEATRVRGLAKPTYTAWLVNQLFWNARRDLDGFMKAADRVRTAEKAALEGRRASMGDAADSRAQALAALVTRATARAAEEGTPLSPALAERLRTTLDAIGAYGSEAARHGRGRLQEDLDPPGFAALALRGAAAPASERRPPPRLELVKSPPDPRTAQARAALADAQLASGRAEDALVAAREAERRARAAFDQARVRLADAERSLKSARAEVEAAAAALKARQAGTRAAVAAARTAGRALDKARSSAGTSTSRS
jgi:hypothetical protein